MNYDMYIIQIEKNWLYIYIFQFELNVNIYEKKTNLLLRDK